MRFPVKMWYFVNVTISTQHLTALSAASNYRDCKHLLNDPYVLTLSLSAIVECLDNNTLLLVFQINVYIATLQ